MPISDIPAPIQSPLADLLGIISSCQLDPRCKDLELNVVDCLDVYGRKGLTTKCRSEFSDYLECIYNAKSMKRVNAMQQERMRQYLAGERTKANLYTEAPKIDSFVPTYGRNVDS